MRDIIVFSKMDVTAVIPRHDSLMSLSAILRQVPSTSLVESKMACEGGS